MTSTETTTGPDEHTQDQGQELEAQRVLQVPIEQVRPNPRNPRRTVAAPPDLVDSIAAVGVLQPLIVAFSQVYDGKRTYRLIAGHRRLDAAIRAGLPEVPCVVRADLDDPQGQIVAMLAENADRADLAVSEQADAYQELLQLGLTPAKVAKRTGRSRKHVDQRLTLARQSDAVRERADQVPASLEDVLVLDEFADHPDQYQTLARMIGTGQFEFFAERFRRANEEAEEARRYADELRDRGVAPVSMGQLQQEVDEATEPGDERTIDDDFIELDGEPDDPGADDVRAVIDDTTPGVMWFRRRSADDEADEDGAGRPDRDAAAAAQARLRAWRAEHDELVRDLQASARVRWRHLAEQARTVSSDTRAADLLRPVIIARLNVHIGMPGMRDFTRAVIGLPESTSGSDLDRGKETREVAEALAPMGLRRLAAVFHLLDLHANEEARLAKDPGAWKAPENLILGASIAAWQEELSLEWGYELSETEKRLVIEGEQKRAEQARDDEDHDNVDVDGEGSDGDAVGASDGAA